MELLAMVNYFKNTADMISLLVLFGISICRGAEICCESSGDCFTDDPPFDGPSWPLPQCDVPVFTLWRQDMIGSRDISRGNTPEEYNRFEETVYLVHGWTGDGTGWTDAAKDEFLAYPSPMNIIVVDWSEGAAPLYYPQAASNVRVAGSEVADINEQLDPVNSWCVGHSLGAHVCGHTGKNNGGLNRITGLDPAGPNWDLPGCAADPVTCRLNPQDASQVDVITTDGRVAGTLNILGDITFFPNGGISPQPGCDNSDCSHGIVTDFFQASINNDCFVTSHHQCSDPQDLPNSCVECGPSECPNMGASTTFGSGEYYLETNPEYPYCQSRTNHRL